MGKSKKKQQREQKIEAPARNVQSPHTAASVTVADRPTVDGAGVPKIVLLIGILAGIAVLAGVVAGNLRAPAASPSPLTTALTLSPTQAEPAKPASIKEEGKTESPKLEAVKSESTSFVPPKVEPAKAPQSEVSRAETPKADSATPVPSSPPKKDPPKAPEAAPAGENDMFKMAVYEAVMVVQDLDYGTKPPPLAQALKDIERRYEPDDGVGRTFAILDVHTQEAPEGKLQVAMHLSSEKAGTGELIFKPTGKVLWHGRIGPEEKPMPAFGGIPLRLRITIEDDKGKPQLVDGSKGGASIIEFPTQNGTPIKNFWPDGAERDATFFYSACGCPVHVKVKRVGNKTVRVSDSPLIFPDNPDAAATIAKLMGWK